MTWIANWKSGIIIVVVFVFLSGCVSGPDVQKNSLIITSSPPGSDIYLDNQYQGTTPVTILEVTRGTHTLEYRHIEYQSGISNISVTAADSSNYYAALTPIAIVQQPSTGIMRVITTTPSTAAVSIQAGKKTMIVGDSNIFSGIATGTNRVLLTLYGPGVYADGKSLVQQNVESLGTWRYIWNPGSSARAGSYTMIVTDSWKTTEARTDFTVIGGGLVSISPNSYSVGRGDVITFSGQCTSGAQNVMLVLSGPGSFASESELGPISVTAEQTWSFKYTIDSTMPTGVYTMDVYDIPKTASGNTQFTIGYSS